MVPLSLAIAVFSGRAGRLADRIGPRLLLTAGAASMALSYAGLALTMPLMLLWEVTLPILALNAAGMAMLVSPLSAAVMLATPDSDTGLASGVNNAVARAAGLMAVAALGAVASVVFADDCRRQPARRGVRRAGRRAARSGGRSAARLGLEQCLPGYCGHLGGDVFPCRPDRLVHAARLAAGQRRRIVVRVDRRALSGTTSGISLAMLRPDRD